MEGPRADRPVGLQPHMVAKHMYRVRVATAAKVYVGQIGKVDFGATATGHVVKAPVAETAAAAPHAAERPARPSSFGTRSDYRRAKHIGARSTLMRGQRVLALNDSLLLAALD